MAKLLHRIEIESCPNPDAAVIWLHGLGADGNDFAVMVPELQLLGCPPARFVFPHAPSMPVTLNGGYVMPAWFDILGLEGERREDEAGIRHSAAAIEALIAQQVSLGVAPGRIVLAGFSQGCAMVLHTGLRHPVRLAGILGLSGYLPLAGTVAVERSGANLELPIFLAHGSADPVIPIDRAEASRQALQDLGYGVEWHSYPMAHSVHPQEVRDIVRFLQAVLPANPG